jgi:hypothetical protein
MIGDPHAQAVLLGQRQYPAVGLRRARLAGRADDGEAGVGDLRHAGVVEDFGSGGAHQNVRTNGRTEAGWADGRANDAAGRTSGNARARRNKSATAVAAAMDFPSP